MNIIIQCEGLSFSFPSHNFNIHFFLRKGFHLTVIIFFLVYGLVDFDYIPTVQSQHIF